ncbi:MAG: hypothetical protein AAF938_04525 [Myxococcota bacterium]
MSACASDSDPNADGFDPVASPGLESVIEQGKADGAFGSRDISLNTTVTGETVGEAVALYSIDLQSGDQFTVTVERTSGDLRPAAYLYEDVTTFVRPTNFDVSPTIVTLDFAASANGEHFIAVRAHRGQGGGEFSLTVSCTGGPCQTGSSLTGIARADQCLTRASACFLRRLPSFNGRVGAATAQAVLTECLEEEGPDCGGACDAATDLQNTCNTILDELPRLADEPEACLSELGACLNGCSDANFIGYGEEEFLEAATCWIGHQGSSSSADGSCLDYINGIDVCGGNEYVAGTPEACNALCASTDGAWDEGPWDFCTDECDNLQDEVDAFITTLANDAGEFPDPDSDPAFAYVRYDEIDEAVRRAAEFYEQDFNEEENRTGGRASGQIDGDHLSITRDGRIIGYMVDFQIFIDDPLFDGAGERLYYNVEGDLVTSVSWDG